MPTTTDTVDLAFHPEYWERVPELYRAIELLVSSDDDSLYRRWWTRRAARSWDHYPAQIAYLRQMIASIRDVGYDPEGWRNDAREGTGPITVARRTGGSIVCPRDGSHRACILRALGRPAIAHVWRIG